MKARQLIDGASYNPEVVYAMGQAFDQAWKEIAGRFAGDAKRTKQARLRLAEAVISIAAENSTHVETLKRGALQALAQDYRSGTPPHPLTQPSALPPLHQVLRGLYRASPNDPGQNSDDT